MSAETLNCPMCGAAAATDSPRCEHCGSRLAMVSCPSCFGMMFEGAKFCSHCGARAHRKRTSAEGAGSCPRCATTMEEVTLGAISLRECPKCDGLWVDCSCLERICAEREQQVAVLGMSGSTPMPGAPIESKVRYLPCPVCRKLMNRINFASYSNVIVDICKNHGTWFDRDELRRVVEFLRSGGLDEARQREIEDLEARRRQLKAAQTADRWDSRNQAPDSLFERRDGISLIGAALNSLFRQD